MKPFRDVKIVAVLFLITGLVAVVEMVLHRALELGTGLLAIPAGVGLLRFRNGWRIVALAMLWLSLAILTIVVLTALLGGNASFGSLWTRSPALVAVLTILSVALTFWEIRVLTRPGVRRSFELGDPAA
ncbi:MAG TPA: hypothetical protein VIZ69_07325 [Thermoanaerobaculia bacterium]